VVSGEYKLYSLFTTPLTKKLNTVMNLPGGRQAYKCPQSGIKQDATTKMNKESACRQAGKRW